MALIDYVACPAMQTRLNTLFTDFEPTQTQDAIGVLRAITSPLNTQGLLQKQVDTGVGKIKKVQLKFDQRFTDDMFGATAVQSCAGGALIGDFVEEYEIDATEGNDFKTSITNADLVLRCADEDNTFWIARLIQRAMDGIERKINREIVDDVALNFGNFSSTGTALPVNVETLKANGDYNPRFITNVKREFKKMNFSGAPILFGDNLVDDFFTDMQAACCSNSGENLLELANIKPLIFMRDEYVETQIGADEFIGIAPGAVQLLTFNEFQGPGNMMNTETYVQGTIVNPNSSLMYDYIVKFDCGVWHIQVKKAYKPVYLPAALHKATDKLDGVNWVNNFKVVNP